ncbi:MAG: RdgB/HAM1 family non-canonical purine NTP pyrophosphatase [Patescibacteria group bacterium]|nr:RdgB/HAM1 family non-canonical purine NTP pyrophosphatase [Patescibacteria group bacterium]
MNLVIATNNKSKVREIKKIITPKNFKILSLADLKIYSEVKETGNTARANARLKAVSASKKTGYWSMADDTALVIKSLNGKPGIYAARWAGENFPIEKLADYTLEKMSAVPTSNRQAYFESTICVCSPHLKCHYFIGRVSGNIATAKKGRPKKQMPYDLIFTPSGSTKTFAEMSEQQKNLLSHRAIALKKAAKYLNYVANTRTEQQK